MTLIQEITNEAKQKHTLILPSGKTMTMIMEFSALQTGWFVSFTYETFTLNKMRLVCNPNVLHQYKNLLPFGIGIFVDQNQEPMFQDDFASKRAKLYLLTEEETQDYEDFLSG